MTETSPREMERLAKTATHDAVGVEATARGVTGRRRGLALLVLPVVLAAALLTAVRAISRVERTLAEDARRAVRVVVYQLDRGRELRVPVEPGTEVVRIVAHLVRRGPIAPRPHEIRLSVDVLGERGSHAEDLALLAPPGTGRATADEPAVSVGDPVGVDVDTRGMGRGEMTLSLREIDEADGLLLRFYRREAVSRLDAIRRLSDMDDGKRQHLARRAGRIDWVDLPEAEHDVLIGARWKKVAALSRAGLVERTIALAPPARAAPSDGTSAVTRLELPSGEKAAVVAHGPVRLVARAVGPRGTTIVATPQTGGAAARPVSGEDEVTLEIPAEQTVAVEIGMDRAGVVALRASDPGRIELPRLTRLFRVTPERPAIVNAGGRPLVLRVMARVPMPSTAAEAAILSLVASVAEGRPPLSTTSYPLTANVKRSSHDRYDGHAGGEAPSERATFHVLVPPAGRVTLAPAHGALDLSLAELDPRAVRPVTPIPVSSTSEPTAPGAAPWGGFVPRLPSNAGAFDPDGTVLVHLAEGGATPSKARSGGPLLRFRRPAGADVLRRGERVFVSTSKPLTVDLEGGEPRAIRVAFFAPALANVTIRVDGDEPLRRRKGVAARLTTPRRIAVTGETSGVVVLGDDLAPGRHELTFEAADGSRVWIHVPWVQRAAVDPHWVSGDFLEP